MSEIEEVFKEKVNRFSFVCVSVSETPKSQPPFYRLSDLSPTSSVLRTFHQIPLRRPVYSTGEDVRSTSSDAEVSMIGLGRGPREYP
jgi:hypothetical protein